MSDEELVRPTIILHGHLRAIDQAVRLTGLSPREQISVATLATALAFRRLVEARPQSGMAKRRLLKAMLKDFAAKVRNYGDDYDE